MSFHGFLDVVGFLGSVDQLLLVVSQGVTVMC